MLRKEAIKYTFSLAGGIIFGIMTRPAVEKFCGIERKSKEEKRLSKDIEDEEIVEE